MHGVGGLEGWRWIFILEGILTVVVALVAYFTIYDFPETASFLTQREREFVIHRLKYQGSSSGAKKVAQHEGFDWKYVRDAFTDWQVYLSLFSMPSIQGRQHKGNLTISSVLGYHLPALWHFSLSANHYQGPWIYLLRRSTLNSAYSRKLSTENVQTYSRLR